MIHIWGNGKKDVAQGNYISVMSFSCVEAMALIQFRALGEFITKAKESVTTGDVLSNKQLMGIFSDILDWLGRDKDNYLFTFTLIDKRYIRFMAYYSDLLESNKLNGIERLKALDDVYGSADKELVRRFPELSKVELNKLNEQVRRLLGNKKYPNSQKQLAQSLFGFRYESIDKDKYRDAHLLESAYYIWYKNVLGQGTGTGRKLMVYSIPEDELSEMFAEFMSQSFSSDEEIELSTADAVGQLRPVKFFFEMVCNIIVSVIDNDGHQGRSDDQNKVLREFFMKVWSAMRKDTSLWMVPSDSFAWLQSEKSE